jgi:hypothetical protein
LVPHGTRDQIVDFVRRWPRKTEIGNARFIGRLDIAAGKLHGVEKRQVLL